MDKNIRSRTGYTFVEVLVVIIIIGILAAVASKSIGGATDLARFERTRKILDNLAFATAGNPDLLSGGIRTDYGYIGDIGALPSNWDDLVVNPGGYSTWNGPYIKDKYSSGTGNTYFKLDAWGQAVSSPSFSFSSTGGSETISRQIAPSTNDLLNNTATICLTDLGYSPPGDDYKDSIRIVLTYPNGSGSYTTSSLTPDANGLVSFSSVPIGIHTLQMVYIPDNDTLTRKINIDPGQDYYTEIQFYSDLW